MIATNTPPLIPVAVPGGVVRSRALSRRLILVCVVYRYIFTFPVNHKAINRRTTSASDRPSSIALCRALECMDGSTSLTIFSVGFFAIV